MRPVSKKRQAKDAAAGIVRFNTFNQKPKGHKKPKAKPIKHKGKRAERNQPALDAAYEMAFERSGGVCQWCTRPAEEMHHLRSRSAAAHLRENGANLAHLCSDCHQTWQPQGARFRQLYAERWPYFRAVYNTRPLDEMKVGRLVRGEFVPLSELKEAA